MFICIHVSILFGNVQEALLIDAAHSMRLKILHIQRLLKTVFL
jgi:hypothetical protein